MFGRGKEIGLVSEQNAKIVEVVAGGPDVASPSLSKKLALNQTGKFLSQPTGLGALHGGASTIAPPPDCCHQYHPFPR
jgi:hypothetical protein